MSFIDNLNNPIIREIQKDYNRAIAQKIRNRLQQLENANEKDKRRWVWELLQNANDTVEDRKVDIEIIITQEAVEFRHNGGYFSPRNITNLVHQISSKEGEDSVGRFGTGFLTTHTLSRIIEVKGVFTENEEYYNFEIRLDRTGSTEAELVECIEKTWTTFESNKLIEKPKKTVWSCFKYLNPNKRVAEDTINDFITFVHYNLLFVESIGLVKIINNVGGKHYSIYKKYIYNIKELSSIVSFEVNTDGDIYEKKCFFIDDNQVQAAIEVSTASNGHLSIQPIAHNIPRLFCAFPLVGTESFLFPMILNSRNFMPKTERDGLYLKGDGKEAKTNKLLLLQALKLYFTAIDYLSNQKADNLYLLAQHENFFKDDSFDGNWYKIAVEGEIQNKLLNSKIVKNVVGEFITIEQTFFPFFEENNQLDIHAINRLWNYQSILFPLKTPQKSDVLNWANIIWENCTKFNLEEFAIHLHGIKTVNNLSSWIKKTHLETLEWLDDIIEFYIDKAQLLLDKYNIIPNQNNVFSLKGDLYFDHDIPEILKDVYQILDLGKGWRDRLLNKAIKSLVALLQRDKKVYYINSIITAINAKIEQRKASDHIIQAAVFKLITILPNTSTPNYDYREILYQLSKDLFKTQIEDTLEIKGLPITLWKAADIWLLHYIAKTIQLQESINNLQNFLQKENQLETLGWLNSFFDFLITKNGILGNNIISEYIIIPNQQNNFKSKKDLSLDGNIPNELKDIYILFGKDFNWYERLSSLKITALEKMFRAERKILYVNNIIQGINARIIHKDSNKEQVQRVVFALTSLLCCEEETNGEKNYKEYRKSIYKFSKNLFKDSIPISTEITNLPQLTWKESDEWILNHIVTTIEDTKDTIKLSTILVSVENSIQWLNDFYIFCLKYEKRSYLTNKIYPNQLGELNFKSNLFKDENIAEELKDVLRDLDKSLSIEGEKGWRTILLHENITAFNNVLKLKPKNTKDISDEINKKIPNLEAHPSNALKVTIFRLVALIEKENRHQRKLWEYLRAFYLDEVPKQLKIINNAENFDWQPCFLWCIELLIKDITTLKYVDELEDRLNGNISTLGWLADFIEFIHETEEYKKLLNGEEYAIIPNQNRSFQVKNRLWLDDEIDEGLKKIIRLLNPTWLDNLLDKSIFLELPKDREYTTVDAAIEVDKIFRNYNGNAQKSEYVESIRIISDWMYRNDEKFNRQYLDWVYHKEAELVVATLGSRKKKDEVLQIIQSGNAGVFSKIVKDKKYSNDELEMISANSEQIKSLLNRIKNPPKISTNPIQAKSISDKIKEETDGQVNSVDDLIKEYNKLREEIEERKLKEERTKPKFIVRTETKGGNTDWDAVRRSNELSRERIRLHLLAFKENNQTVYDLSGWTKVTNTIIENIKKNGIFIGLVTKGADNGIIYFNSTEREFLSDTKKFTELWVHSNGKVFQVTLGEILKIWNVQSIKTNMFDLK